jgi:hypothetical protein
LRATLNPDFRSEDHFLNDPKSTPVHDLGVSIGSSRVNEESSFQFRWKVWKGLVPNVCGIENNSGIQTNNPESIAT